MIVTDSEVMWLNIKMIGKNCSNKIKLKKTLLKAVNPIDEDIYINAKMTKSL